MGMSRRPLGNDTIIVQNAELVKDPRDNAWYRDWDNATETEVEGCNIQPTRLSDKLRDEDDHEREFHLTYFRGFAPLDAPLDYTSRVLFEGETYDVQGKPTPWRRLNGQAHHIAFMMKLREG